MMSINTNQSDLVKAGLVQGVKDFKETAPSREETIVMQYLSKTLTTLAERPEFTEFLNQIKQACGYEDMEDFFEALLAPSVKEHTKKIIEISPVYVEGLCKVYSDVEGNETIKATTQVLAVLEATKLSLEEIKISLYILDAEDAKAALQANEKSIPPALYEAFERFFDISSEKFRQYTFETIREKLREEWLSKID